MTHRFLYHWRRFWARYNGPRGVGRLAARFATWGVAPMHARGFLAGLGPRGFVDPGAYVVSRKLRRGRHVFVGGGVRLLLGDREAVEVVFDDGACLYGDTFLQVGSGGSIRIGEGAHVQPGCHFRAFVEPIEIGRRVEIAAGCAFYSFEHGVEPDAAVMDQPLTSKGPIRVGDEAWLGHGVTVLSGVTIGRGAVIGAGSVVTRDVPEGAIAVGTPARVVRFRDGRAASD